MPRITPPATVLGALSRSRPVAAPWRSRPVRFALTGIVAAGAQVTLLAALLAAGVPGLAANGSAFLLAAQVNFLLSGWFTWGDRPRGAGSDRTLARRWLLFHASIAGTALLNMLVFAAARRVAPDLAASLAGIAAASAVNFFAHDRLAFRRARARTAVAPPTRPNPRAHWSGTAASRRLRCRARVSAASARRVTAARASVIRG
jgi:putative flippase GtrA